jgi:hypothetical protein
MPKYMIVYKGDATAAADMTEEQQAEVMAKWGAWMEAAGSAIADIGTPLGDATSVVDDGSTGTAVSMSGYSIIEAGDMEGAKRVIDGHPYLSDRNGDFAIDIYEMLPVPM